MMIEHDIHSGAHWNLPDSRQGERRDVKRILVVDDERPLREVICEVLRDEGYLVHEAADGLAALAMLDEARPDLVLMDVMMPGMTGTDTYNGLRARSDFASVPVVMMSAAVDGGRLDPSISAFVPKPFSIDKLLALIDRLLTQKGDR